MDDIASHLDLQPGDSLLDLCCGNGLITANLASKCSTAVGIDYSEPLLTVAKRDHQRDNIIYIHASILDLDHKVLSADGRFSKIMMYEALQHFKKRDLSRILQVISSLTTDDALILIGSIPDRIRKRNFYNTPKRQLVALWRQLTGRDSIGSWWTSKEISRIARQRGFHSQVLTQNQNLHTSHYRFDVLLRKAQMPTGSLRSSTFELREV
ncbi:class I SAM-dependent methyltransferase [Candidatus Neomarinimicrobiota bacterium]